MGRSHRSDAVGLRVLFDSPGDDLELQTVAEVDEALHEVGLVAVDVEPFSKGLVDPQEVDRELP